MRFFTFDSAAAAGGCSQELHHSHSSCHESAVSISCHSGEKTLHIAASSLALSNSLSPAESAF